LTAFKIMTPQVKRKTRKAKPTGEAFDAQVTVDRVLARFPKIMARLAE
jgi:hypothetical protein